MKPLSVSGMSYADAEKTAINMTVVLASIGEVQTTVRSDDAETSDLFHRATSGEFGDIADCPATSIDEAKTALSGYVQQHLDSAARLRGYDSILSACSYAAGQNPFQAEGQAFVAWRGDVWASCYTMMAEVQAGTRPVPTAVELLAALPVLVLPE